MASYKQLTDKIRYQIFGLKQAALKQNSNSQFKKLNFFMKDQRIF
jgi:hypothetical protein